MLFYLATEKVIEVIVNKKVPHVSKSLHIVMIWMEGPFIPKGLTHSQILETKSL